jgi:hypothetical protein
MCNAPLLFGASTKTRSKGGITMAFPHRAGVQASYVLGLQHCPNCNEELFVAEGATHKGETIRFEWCCDLCGHRFETAEATDTAAD